MRFALQFTSLVILLALASGGIALLCGASATNARALTVYALLMWPVCGFAGSACIPLLDAIDRRRGSA